MKITVKIKINSKKQSIIIEDNFMKIGLKSQPIEGKANAELINLISKTCKIPKSNIAIKTGLHSKNKTLEITGIEKDDFISKLATSKLAS